MQFLLVLFAAFLSTSDSAKILFSSMPSSSSHIGSMLPVARALHGAGHDVHFLETTDNTPFKFPDGIKNHTIALPSSGTFDDLLPQVWIRDFRPEGMVSIFQYGDEILQKTLNYGYQELQTVLNTTWDVIFSDELFSMTSYGLTLRNARKYKTPYIMFSTTVLNNLFSWEQALARSFLLTPSLFSFYGDDRAHDPARFMDRLGTLLEGMIVSTSIKYGTENSYTRGVEMLGVKDFTFTEAWSNTAFNFQEEINFLGYPQPMSTDVIYVGSHCPSKSGLSSDMKKFLDVSDSNGTVYIAFGTNVKWQYAPKSSIEVYKRFLTELKGYHILFVTDSKEFDDHLPNVKISRWAPQYDVLSHPNTKLMISHCGLKSFKESICSKTPTICLPMFAEQTHNAALAAKLGFARSIGKVDLSAEKLLKAAYDMLENKKYKERAERIHGFYIDRPMSTLDEAVFWTNRTLRVNTRKPTFKRKGMYLPVAFYFHIIEIAILLLTIFVLSK